VAAVEEAVVYSSEAIQRQAGFFPICALLAIVIGPSALGQSPITTATPRDSAQGGIEAHLGAGYADLKSDRYPEAAREFRAALALDPKLAMRARFPLAVALFESHQLTEARKEFDAVRAEAGDLPSVTYYLGRLDLLSDNLDGAIRDLSLAAAKPPFPDTAYYLGLAYLRKGDLPAAEKWLQSVAQLNPQDFHTRERLAALYRQQGKSAEAKEAAAQAEILRNRDARVSQKRIACAQALQSGSSSGANAVCGQLYDPNDADELTMLGTLYGQHGDYEQALKPLRRAAELDPNSPQTHYNLALDCFRLRRYAEARDTLANVVKLWPDLAPLNALYGGALYKLGDKAAAYEALRRAYQLDPQDSGAATMLYDTGLSLAKESLAGRQYAESVRYLNEMAQLFPQTPEPHRLLAEVYRAAGRPAQAAQEQKQFENKLAQAGMKSP
jgi:tetratricopeptide (TPR) repeat protein